MDNNRILEILRREIELGREIYTNDSPTKRAKLLEVYPISTEFVIIGEVVQSEFGNLDEGRRINLNLYDVLSALGY
jgi:hypothetical protein